MRLSEVTPKGLDNCALGSWSLAITQMVLHSQVDQIAVVAIGPVKGRKRIEAMLCIGTYFACLMPDVR
jgi:hypothetical protein